MAVAAPPPWPGSCTLRQPDACGAGTLLNLAWLMAPPDVLGGMAPQAAPVRNSPLRLQSQP